MWFTKKRKDTKLKNVSDVYEKVKEKYRSESHLETILKRENVTSLHLLKKKYRDERILESILKKEKVGSLDQLKNKYR